MKIQIKRDLELIEVNNVTVVIGELRYKVSESIDGGLVINKVDFEKNSAMSVLPQYANQIEIK